MKTYTLQLICRVTEKDIGRVVIQALDWRSADRIAVSLFSNGEIVAWIEEDGE